MGCLVARNHDPAAAVSLSTAASLAMTAMDTTNLRATFTVPASGRVTVRLKVLVHGATTFPQILLGVLQGSTVICRDSPMGVVRGTSLATTHVPIETVMTIQGLTPGAQLTWDAAYGVETGVAATGIKFGGPNDATANNAFGAAVFEIWDAT